MNVEKLMGKAESTVATPLFPFEELIKKYDLANNPVECSNQFESISDLIPNRAHFIYVVNPIRDKDQLALIAQFKALNPDYATTLWIDKSVYSEEAISTLTDWAKEKSIHLLDIVTSIAPYLTPLDNYYQFELLRKKPGAASDILRILILKHFGGIYSDIDVLCVAPLGTINDSYGMQVNFGERTVTKAGQHPLREHDENSEQNPNNDMLIARPYHPFLDEYIARIQQNYEKTASELFPKDGTRDFHYEQDYETVGNALFRKQWTIYATGPGALLNTVDATEQLISKQVSVTKNFIFGCSLSWMNENKTENLSEEEEIQRLVNCISVDIHHEPRVLRLAGYAALCLDDVILDKAFARLTKEHPEYFTEVERVHNLQQYEAAGLYPDGEFLFNKNIFPKLNHEKLLSHYIASVLTTPQINENKIVGILSLIKNREIPICEEEVIWVFNHLAYTWEKSIEIQSKAMALVIEAFNERFAKDFRIDVIKTFIAHSLNLDFINYLIQTTDREIPQEKALIKIGKSINKLKQGMRTFCDPNLTNKEQILEKLAEKTQEIALSLKDKAQYDAFYNSNLLKVTSVYLANTRFNKAQLMGAKFEYCHLQGCSFKQANLTNAVFKGETNLSRADFSQAILNGTDFSEPSLNLQDVIWAGATFSLKTPPKLDWNKYGPEILLQQLIYIGKSAQQITHQKQELTALVNWILHEITDISSLKRLPQLIENEPALQGEEEGQVSSLFSYFTFFHSQPRGNIVSQVKNWLSEQLEEQSQVKLKF
ncbi:pentapeptide repeat-containing protein [Legionella lytica]|uniref:Pentapeptide repeat-containing protein n=1 Tax=Legionella lytica TaxID=96232 RepID=A0ABW8D8U9_9GAMM